MKRQNFYLITIFFLLVLAPGVSAHAKIKKGAAFPTLALRVLQAPNAKSSGRGVASVEAPASLSLQDFKGKVVLVDFWATWCEPCRFSMPAYEKLQAKYKKRGLVVLGVSVDTNESDARTFLTSHKITFPVVYDQDRKLAEDLGVAIMPTSYIIDRKGSVKVIHPGFRAQSVSELEKSIRKAL